MFGGLAAVVAAVALAPGVATYPSSQTIAPSGRLQAGAGTQLSFNTAIGEREGGWVVVTGARSIAAAIDPGTLGPIKAAVFFGHYVAFGPRLVPDALLPWDGSARAPEQPNQPLYVQVLVPYDAKPGTYRATVTVTADGRPTPVPLTVRVFNVTLPEPSNPAGNLLTSFHFAPESYVNKAAQLYGFTTNTQRQDANTALYAFMANYRISPAGWGFGEPKSAAGYQSSPKWWLDAAGNMVKENAVGFSAMRLPISSQRASARNYVAGISPFKPDAWCDYLRAVRGFWDGHGWLSRTPYLYTIDEPGAKSYPLIEQQAATAHRCLPESKTLITGNPSPGNAPLWDGKNGDDVDIWVVLSRRYYGQFTNPQAPVNRARQSLQDVDAARKRRKTIWSYTYTAIDGTPGFTATEPLSNPRMLFLWNALEGIQGVLYGQGTTNYKRGNPLEAVDQNGEFVLLYPGATGPIASARLEQIRDGIEDWAVYNIVARRRGIGAVRAILGGTDLFSADAKGVKLGCNLGCELKTETKYSWPEWSSDATTASLIERAKLQALTAAAG